MILKKFLGGEITIDLYEKSQKVPFMGSFTLRKETLQKGKYLGAIPLVVKRKYSEHFTMGFNGFSLPDYCWVESETFIFPSKKYFSILNKLRKCDDKRNSDENKLESEIVKHE